jgi:RND family efflux transporter MFP subunit
MRNLLDPRISCVVALAPFVLAAGCGRSPVARADAKAAPAVARVEVVKPEKKTVRRTTEQPGEVEAYEVTPIYARVAGYVKTWSAQIGDRVKTGQVLAELDVPEVAAEADQKGAAVEEASAREAQAVAAVEVAKANLVSAGAKLDEANAGVSRAAADVTRWRAEMKRVEQLFKESALTGSLLDETRSKREAAEAARAEVAAQVKTAEAAVRQAQAMLDRAKADATAAAAGVKVARFDARRAEALRSFATIAAPYDGTVTQRGTNVGDLTEPGPNGKPLYTVARDDRVRVVVNVPEMFATAVEPGDPVRVRLQALPGRVVEGKVARSSWALEKKSRSVRVEVDMENPEGAVRPGLYATAVVTVEEHDDALTLPTSAVVRTADGQAYCVVVVDGRAVKSPVRLGIEDGTSVEVISGLRGSETVVKAGAGSLSDGQALVVVTPEKGKS